MINIKKVYLVGFYLVIYKINVKHEVGMVCCCFEKMLKKYLLKEQLTNAVIRLFPIRHFTRKL